MQNPRPKEYLQFVLSVVTWVRKHQMSLVGPAWKMNQIASFQKLIIYHTNKSMCMRVDWATLKIVQ